MIRRSERMSPRRTRAATVKQSVSTRSKTKEINNVSENVSTSIQKVKQRKEKPVKKNLEAAAKQNAKKESSDAKATVKKSAKKKTVRRRLNLNKEVETENMNQNVNSNDSIRMLKDRYCNDATLELVKHNLLQPNATKDLELEKLPNGKLQQKTSVKISPIIVTPKSTPPKLSLTPHRSKKTPKKSPISLGSPKTHSIAIPKLFKSPRKLSLATTDEHSKENLEKSDSDSHAKKTRKNKKNNLSNSPTSDKDALISSRKNKHKKSDINLKVIVNINCERKFSKSPKIVLKSPKSKKSKSRKLKLSPSRMKKSVKTSTSPNTALNHNNANSPRICIKKSPLSKGKNLSIKRRLLNPKLMKTLTTSQIKDVLTEPIVLLEKLSPESLKRKNNVMKIASKTQSDILMKVRSPSIKTGSNSKIIPIKKVSADTFIKRNSSPKLRNSSMKKSQINNINRISPRIKCNTSIQGRDISIPLMSSTPQNEKMAITNTSLASNISITSVNNASLNIRLKHRNQSSMQMSNMNENTDIKNISEPSLFDKEINNTSQSFLLNLSKRDTSYNKNNTMEKKQENNRNNTYELEQPQTISLRQMIKKRTPTNANISLRDSVKKAKVRFADVTLGGGSERKSINKLNGSRSSINRISHVNTQKRSNNIMNSAHKSKNDSAKPTRNLLISPFKRSSPRIGGIPRIQLNKIQVTPKTFKSVEKKSEKKSSTKKVPNFGKIHERMFNKSESLVDAKKRLEARHIAFTANKTVSKADVKTAQKKPLPTDTKDGIHNRFGFKLKKSEATHIMLKKQTDFSRQKHQHETRTMLKGIRTNRRFELQMKARNLNL